MRTTLDIDDDVLQAAKELARTEKKTAGKVLSELVRKGLAAPADQGVMTTASGLETKNGWYLLPRRGVIVTNEMVERILEEADLADAGVDPKSD